MLHFSRFYDHAVPEIVIDDLVPWIVKFDESDGSGFIWETGDLDNTHLEIMFLHNGGLCNMALVSFKEQVTYIESPMPRRFVGTRCVQPAAPAELWSDLEERRVFPLLIEEVPSVLALQCYSDGVRLELVGDGRNSPIWVSSGRVSFGLDSQLRLAAIEIADIDAGTMALMRAGLSSQARHR